MRGWKGEEEGVTAALTPLAPAASPADFHAEAAAALAPALGSDQLAAEYALLHCLSSVAARPDAAAAEVAIAGSSSSSRGAIVGKLTLELRGFPAGAAAAAGGGGPSACAASVAAALLRVLPRALLLPLSIAALNSGPPLCPAKGGPGAGGGGGASLRPGLLQVRMG